MINKEQIEFIKNNINADVRELALKKGKVPFLNDFILTQISSRQKAKKKLPNFYNNYDLIFPSSLSIQQSSSEQTAKYKSQLINGEKLIDLTGGFGIDSYYFSKVVKSVDLIEIDGELSKIVNYNFDKINAKNINVLNADSEKVNLNSYNWIYIDPDRRKAGKKNFLIKDLKPDLNKIISTNIESKYLIKMSPMFEYEEFQKQLIRPNQVLAVSLNGELKELLFIIDNTEKYSLKSVAINNNIIDEYLFEEKTVEIGELKSFLIELDPSLMKLRLNDSFASSNNLVKISSGTNYYTSDIIKKSNFTNNYEIISVYDYKVKELKKLFNKANIKSRNFIDRPELIKKKLELEDGGDVYLFFFKDQNGDYKCVETKKAAN